jgi:hypothetical protein
VGEAQQQSQEVFVPLVHRPGEAQVDFGEALVRLGGRLRGVKFFLMALPYSDAFFVMAFEREYTETFGDQWGSRASEVGGHVQSIYKNLAPEWDQIRNSRSHQAVRVFTYYKVNGDLLQHALEGFRPSTIS